MTTPINAGKFSQYESTVREFIYEQNGCFIAVTQDQSFLTMLRTVLTKHLNIAYTSVLINVQETSQAIKALKAEESARRRPILFLERTADTGDTSFLVREFKTAYPDLLIIVLTAEAERHRIMYLHEVGADNFIAKPVSAQTVIEKIAFTLRPQTKLGQAIDKAKQYLNEGKLEEALQAAKEVLEIKPGSAAGLMVLGDAQMAIGRMEAAREAYLAASRNARLYMEPLRKLAELAEVEGNLEDRLQYLEKLDQLSPLNSERKVNMGEIHLSLGHEERAEQLFELALDQVTSNALGQVSVVTERIAALYTERDPLRAEQYLRRAIKLKKNHLTQEDVRLFNQLGISLRQQGQWLKAVEEYEKALKIAPNDASLHYNLGMAYAEGKNYTKAIGCMEKSLAINPDFPSFSGSIAYNFGVVCFYARDMERAKKYLRLATELEPGMENARQILAMMT